jgi:hypothetical protein
MESLERSRIECRDSPATLGQILARETNQNAGGMKLRTSYANHRHGENFYGFGDCRQRQ